MIGSTQNYWDPDRWRWVEDFGFVKYSTKFITTLSSTQHQPSHMPKKNGKTIFYGNYIFDRSQILDPLHSKK